MLDLDAVVLAVAASKKYGTLCEDTIRRVAERELASVPCASLKAAVKITRRRLHQVYGAFEQPFDAWKAYHRLEAAYRSGSQAQVEAACRGVMGFHQSTRERLPILDRFYQAIWEVTGKPQSVLDLGCGLNPLALPWMGLAKGTRIIALDVDRERVEWLNRVLALAGIEPLARCQDLLVRPPGDVADVALLLKMAPTLERQEPGSTGRLIERLQAPAIVVSFAVKSLGGHEKGMAGTYRQQFMELAAGRGWQATELRFPGEQVFIVRKQAV